MFCALSGCPPLLFILTRHLCISRFQWHRPTYSAKKQEKQAQIWLKKHTGGDILKPVLIEKYLQMVMLVLARFNTLAYPISSLS